MLHDFRFRPFRGSQTTIEIQAFRFGTYANTANTPSKEYLGQLDNQQWENIQRYVIERAAYAGINVLENVERDLNWIQLQCNSHDPVKKDLLSLVSEGYISLSIKPCRHLGNIWIRRVI